MRCSFPLQKILVGNGKVLLKIDPAHVIVGRDPDLEPVAFFLQNLVAFAEKKLCYQFRFIRSIASDRYIAQAADSVVHVLNWEVVMVKILERKINNKLWLYDLKISPELRFFYQHLRMGLPGCLKATLVFYFIQALLP